MAKKEIKETTAEEIVKLYEGDQPEAQDDGADLIKLEEEE